MNATAAAPPAKRPRQNGACPRPKALPVYICEYHDEALRCLHHAIRRRRVPFGGNTMVHLDAHPDLSASLSVPAKQVFESPSDLYFAMRTDPSGIAQWILPAVYGGHFRCVWWVRPEWAAQIRDGDHHAAVGRASSSRAEGRVAKPGGGRMARHLPGAPTTAGSASGTAGGAVATLGSAPSDASVGAVLQQDSASVETVCISCPEPYFVEDGIFCPEADLLDAKPLRLLVSELPTNGSMPLRAAEPSAHPESVGSWTLDVCLDYFACGNPFLRRIRPRVAEPFAAVQNSTEFRQGPVSDVPSFLATCADFDRAYARVLREALDSEGEARVSDAALQALAAFLVPAQRDGLMGALQEALEEARHAELQEVLEAGDMITLPVHAGSEADVAARLSAFEAFLEQLCCSELSGLQPRPAAVTVARSVVDGFCPMRWHLLLERRVLDVLERRFGALDVVFSDELDALENP